MAMSKDERNRRRREKYKQRRAAGLTRSQARAPKKSASILESVWSTLSKIGDAITGLVEKPLPDSFELFASEALDANPKRSANSIMKEWRDRGGTISTRRGNLAVSDLKNYITTYTNANNPDKKKYFKDKYIYKIRYEVTRSSLDGGPKPTNEERYASVATDRNLTKRQVYDELMEMIKELDEDGDERYQVESVVPNSVTILYRIDTTR